MGLSKKSVENAWYILNDINHKANNSFIQSHSEFELPIENTILGYDKKSDGSWENVFMYIKNITKEQLEIFEIRKEEISNTSFTKKLKDEYSEYTCIGWI